LPWYARWFDDELYTEVYGHRDTAEAKRAVDLFVAATGLDPAASRILDLACGTGRHAWAFARRGAHVVAADLSPTLLAVARRGTRGSGEAPRFVRCDMRRLPFRPSMHGVVQLFTAFGYFPTDGENIAVVAEVARVLLEGGWYMLDFLNAAALRSHLDPRSETAIPGGTVVQERWIADDRVEKRITVRRGGSERSFRESVRLYTADDLASMLASCGFTLRRIAGSYAGTAFHPSSPRCILFAQLAS
jgi:ubiquinone/menaquinone biosynthesis C-methylase UbiE